MLRNSNMLVMAGTVLGIGMGGFVDGILFHQILQTHSMLSARIPKIDVVNVEINMFWDGIFHAATWIVTAFGLVLLWQAAKRNDTSWKAKPFTGSLFYGWGLFNLVEGVIDHHILNLHHVVERLGVSIYDYLVLLLSAVFIVGGRIAIHQGMKQHVEHSTQPHKSNR